jgi:hypothetical protein
MKTLSRSAVPNASPHMLAWRDVLGQCWMYLKCGVPLLFVGLQVDIQLKSKASNTVLPFY